jgi:hypothetical protein
MSDGGASQSPEGVAAETDRDEGEEKPSERLVRNGMQCTPLVCRRSPEAEGELESENTDSHVNDCTGDKPGTGEPLESS